MITSDEVRVRYDPTLPIRLATDASPYGIGAVLSHVINEEERPIAYASRTLNKAEQNYSQIDKEALSIVWAVKKFFNYLCCKHFTLITDHEPLKYIFNPTKGIPQMSAARQQRYALFLSGFDYNIEYRRSKANANADGLSRLPLPTTVDSEELEKANDVFFTEILDTMPVNVKILSQESRKDTVISKIIQYVESDNWPNDVTPETRPYANKRHELSVQQNCLLWGYRAIPPNKLRNDILNTLHMGHLGVVKMKNLARKFFWWPSVDKDIEHITKGCSGCANSQPNPPSSPLHPWHWPEKPWQRIHIDYAGPFMGSMFLVIVDANTKWMEVIPTQLTTSLVTISILSSTFARFGLPQQLVSDNGAQFTSDEFKKFTKSNGIRHILSSPYHPSTNGLAERAVQSFKCALKSSKGDNGSLHMKLARFLFAYRNAPHSTTNQSPAFLMFGRTLRSHLDLMRPDTSSTVNQNQQSQVNNHSQVKLRTFKEGDAVLVRDYRKDKLWQRGIIQSSTGPLNYQVEISPGVCWRRHVDQIVHTEIPESRPSPVIDTFVRTPDIPNDPIPQTDSSKGGMLGEDLPTSTPRPPVELSCSPPKKVESTHSPSLPYRQASKGGNKKDTYTTRSGRVVRMPNKYTE